MAKGLIFALEVAALSGGGANVLWEALMCIFMGRLGGEGGSLELALTCVVFV